MNVDVNLRVNEIDMVAQARVAQPVVEFLLGASQGLRHIIVESFCAPLFGSHRQMDNSFGSTKRHVGLANRTRHGFLSEIFLVYLSVFVNTRMWTPISRSHRRSIWDKNLIVRRADKVNEPECAFFPAYSHGISQCLYGVSHSEECLSASPIRQFHCELYEGKSTILALLLRQRDSFHR